MNCASCGRTNPAGARFCGGCGTSLAPRCRACGAEALADARFCIGCGASLAPSGAHAEPQASEGRSRLGGPEVSRKIVTIVFADLIGSVALHERLDAESARRLMDRYHRAMSAAVDVHGGRVIQLLGDGVLAAFGVPRVAEDDAIRAVRAAVGMQRAFRELAREQSAALGDVGLRVAVNTGEIVVGDDASSVMGDPTNVAARLQQEARDGDVIVGEATQRLVGELVTLAPLGSFALRGRAETVTAFRVVSLERPAGRTSIAFVGRDAELRRLVAVYEDAVATPAARLVVLLGSPGLGKSRLVAEFTRRAGERATVLSARCEATGGATFGPLAEALRALLRIDEGAGGDVLRAAIDAVMAGDETERTRVAAGIGALLAGTPAPPEETFFVVRRLLRALAAVRPVVLVIDDLQWAEPLLLDLVEHLVQWSSGVPLLVVVAARPELRDARSSLAAAGGVVAEVVTLGGLDAGAATRLAASVGGGAELPAALAGRVLATSEGNPLFVAELVRMLVSDGTLVRQGDRWTTTVEIAKLDMPPTIHVLLAARIERLRPEERGVLERAAVIGRQFSRAAVAHLMPAEGHDLDARLEALRRSELIEPDTGWYLGEPALRFHHVLIRDAAYRRVLKETRAALHARIAEWIGARAGGAVEHDETIGWHLEQAHQHLRELGALGESGRALGERAARHLGAAGRRALARDDLALAAGLRGRAIDRLDPADAARADLALDWCESLLAAGDVAPAADAIDELGRLAADSERLRAWHACFAGQLAALTDPQALRTTADTLATAAETLAAANDAAGEAKAHSVRAMALARLGEIGACESVLDRALAAARSARDRRRANAVLAGAPFAALWGPSPVTRASGRCLDVVRVLRITQGAPAVEAAALRCQAVLETLRGRGEAGRRMIASSRRMVEELGIAQQILECDVFAGHIELLEGDAQAAEQSLRVAYEGLRERGLGIDAARAAALLGRALLAQNRAAEAEAISHESEALAGDDLKAAIAWRGVRAEALAGDDLKAAIAWRGVRAEALARRGDAAAAVELARAAVALAAATDALLDHADARIALATALRAAGRDAEADAETTHALDLWAAKGATLLTDRTPRAAGAPATGVATPAPTHEPERRARSRVRPNAATADAARLDDAVAVRDLDAIARVFERFVEAIHHPTGIVYDRDAAVASFRIALESRDLAFRQIPLATLGDSLALCLQRSASSAAVRGAFDVAAFESEHVWLIEVDAEGRRVRSECFGTRIDDAVARLYERHAERLPEGAERDRAAAVARAVAAVLPTDVDAIARVLAPQVAFTDHRTLGFAPIRGADGYLRGLRSLLDVARDPLVIANEILDARPDALLARRTTGGSLATSGGAFEHHFLMLWVFGADGRIAHIEMFESDRELDALARLAVLAEAASGPRSAEADRLDRRFAASRDAQRPEERARPDAIRGGSAAERRDAISRAFGAAFAARDWDALGALLAPDLVVRDHRLLGWEPLHGADAYVQGLRSLVELAPDVALRIDHVAIAPPRFLYVSTWIGTRDGGPFETPSVILSELGADGRIASFDTYDLDRLDELRARLAEAPPDPLRIPPNAAMRAMEGFGEAVGARDWDALDALLAAAFTFEDRRRGIGMAGDKATMLASVRVAASTDVRWSHELLATAGDRLLLTRNRFWTADGATLLSEIETLQIAEVDEHGRLIAHVVFDPDDRRAASLELSDRFLRSDESPSSAGPGLATMRALFAHDLETVRALLPGDFFVEDHRRFGMGRVDGADAFVDSFAALFERSADLVLEGLYTVAVAEHGYLDVARMFGTLSASGGAFESVYVRLLVLRGGRLIGLELYDPEDLDAARARFEALRGD